MKCDRCGWNDATRYYRSVVNGRTTEAHLCANCARELGYESDWSDSFGDLFSLLPRMVADESFFASPRLTPSARRTLHVLPAQEQEEPEPVEEPILSDDEQRTLRRERERNALQLALSEALEAEDYERAAKLRDELKKLED
ncbi:MAG: UvrB/UvrC motif-containing protein [Oscillospiraceae bacterium]|nr:UvrB/UvrC motif-containing protein [Oscillospiraceae bacterium]